MPRKGTPEERYMKMIAEYRRILPMLSQEEQDVLKSIEENKYAGTAFQNPLQEAAETLMEWIRSGLVCLK